jgi:hypothetical protein
MEETGVSDTPLEQLIALSDTLQWAILHIQQTGK